MNRSDFIRYSPPAGGGRRVDAALHRLGAAAQDTGAAVHEDAALLRCLAAVGGLSALLAAVWGSTVAAAGSLVLWSLRLFGGAAVVGQWHTSAPVLLAAGAMVVGGAAVRPRVPRSP